MTNGGEGVEKRGVSCTVGGSATWCSHCGNNVEVHQKSKTRITIWSVIPLLGIYLGKTIIQEDTCTPKFIAAQSTIARTWKQPKCEWIKKMWYIYTMKYYLAIKKNEIMPFTATWMQVEIIILSMSERERQIPHGVTYMWNLKYGTNELIYKTEIDSQT